MDTSPTAPRNALTSPEIARHETQRTLNQKVSMLVDVCRDMLDKAIEIARSSNNEVMRHVEVGQNDPSQARSAFRLAARAFLSVEQNGAMQIIDKIGKEFGKDMRLYKRGRMAAKKALKELAFQLYDTGVSSDFPEDWNKETIALFKELVF